MDRSIQPDRNGCGHKCGSLPECAPLAVGFIPFQEELRPVYENREALTRGTLFPGLDLPFMNVVNKGTPYDGTHLGELMAIDFAIKELNLYLDTHKDDTEAFDMLKRLLGLSREGKARYVKMHGPLSLADLENCEKYTWLSEPWPWEYKERVGKD